MYEIVTQNDYSICRMEHVENLETTNQMKPPDHSFQFLQFLTTSYNI